MELRGTVVSWKGGVARVRIAVSPCAACGHSCAARSADGGRYLLVHSATPLAPGQAVVVDASLPSPARAVALAYLLPLAGFMVGLFLGNAACDGAPLPALGAGLAGAAVAYGAVALLERPRRARVRLVGGPRDAVCPQQ
ncbi:SoxR reducing system RseC family protein [Symbiobacterium terraclitae]|uniref:SoxR reducing system RseC family protein n=1 Tax=Symbiobacterium terraclitae TaxID=557451 RepID=UPI0035B56303